MSKYKFIMDMDDEMRKELGKIAKKNKVKMAYFVKLLIAEALQKEFRVIHSSIVAKDIKQYILYIQISIQFIIINKNMDKAIEKIVKQIFAKDIEIKMLDKELEGFIIDKDSVLEILSELLNK